MANLRSVYDIRSNAESGFRRADILMIPKESWYSVAYAFEFKSIQKDEDLEISARHALEQIHKKQYDTLVTTSWMSPQQVRRFAIVLQGKRVIVRE